MNDIIAGGQRFKRETLQAFVDNINHMVIAKHSHLLKLKYIFSCPLERKIDFEGFLSEIGIETCPESIEALNSLKMTQDKLDIIDNIYISIRTVEISTKNLSAPQLIS